MKKHIKLIFIVICVWILALSAGCEDPAGETFPSVSSQQTYTIRVQSEAAQPMSGIKIFVYEDVSLSELVSVGKTGEDGCISFIAPISNQYAAVFQNIPMGYSVDAVYTLKEINTVVSLSSRELTQEELSAFRYALGDKMRDFSITDCEGQRHQLSELLDKKKTVVLNFWYLNCGPCKMEFPYVQEVYESLGDSAAFLALNPVDGSDEEIHHYMKENHLTFPMAKCDIQWQSLMGISAYPTTVIIDREGYICLIHEGMFTDSEALSRAIVYFSSADYRHQTFQSIEEIPSVYLKAENHI